MTFQVIFQKYRVLFLYKGPVATRYATLLATKNSLVSTSDHKNTLRLNDAKLFTFYQKCYFSNISLISLCLDFGQHNLFCYKPKIPSKHLYSTQNVTQNKVMVIKDNHTLHRKKIINFFSILSEFFFRKIKKEQLVDELEYLNMRV